MSSDWDKVQAQIVDEIRAERRKDEVRNSLKKKTVWTSVANAAKHPAILLILTFLVTTVVGTQLTSAWQQSQHELQRKYALIDNTNKAIAEYLTAANDIVGLYQDEKDAPNRKKLEDERWTYWQERSRQWRISANILQQQLRSNFTDENIGKNFAAIDDASFELSRDIKNLKGEVDKSNWKVIEVGFSQKEPILDKTENLRESAAALVALMEKDIRDESGKRTRWFPW